MEFTHAEIWTMVGVGFLILEIAAPSFFAFFFGIGGITVALTSYIGITSSWEIEIVIFVLISVISLLLFRKQISAMLHKEPKEYIENIGETAKVVTAIQPKQEGRVFYRGAEWIAINESQEPKNIGDSVIIIGLEGLRLKVK
jgi:membrane protein implicated in regulation of membrane protease activity